MPDWLLAPGWQPVLRPMAQAPLQAQRRKGRGREQLQAQMRVPTQERAQVQVRVLSRNWAKTRTQGLTQERRQALLPGPERWPMHHRLTRTQVPELARGWLRELVQALVLMPMQVRRWVRQARARGPMRVEARAQAPYGAPVQ